MHLEDIIERLITALENNTAAQRGCVSTTTTTDSAVNVTTDSAVNVTATVEPPQVEKKARTKRVEAPAETTVPEVPKPEAPKAPEAPKPATVKEPEASPVDQIRAAANRLVNWDNGHPGAGQPGTNFIKAQNAKFNVARISLVPETEIPGIIALFDQKLNELNSAQ